MKRILTTISLLIFAAVLFTGCSSTKSAVHEDSSMAAEFKDAPEWVIDGGSIIEETLAAVGSAGIGKAGLNFARTEAMAQARNEMSRIIQVQVNDMVRNFTQQIGVVGDDQTVDKLSAQISSQVAKQSLAGSRQKASWISPSSTLYILVTLDSENVKNYVKESVATSMANEKALWQQFQAKKGFEELNAEIAREFGE